MSAREPASAAEDLIAPYLRELGVAGAAVSTIGGLSDPETLSASDKVAARIDEAQLDLGEGPCWDAAASRQWVESPDFAEQTEIRWPAFREVALTLPVRGLFALPLSVAGLGVGMIDLWSTKPGPLSPSTKRDAELLAQTTARQVLRASLDSLDHDEDEDDPRPRAIIHQATGMILAQVDVTPDEALLLLKGRAFSSGRKLRDVARDVLERRLDFSHPDSDSAT